MGVSNAAQILYKSAEISWENIVYIENELNENNSGPCIDIDINLLGFKFNGNVGGPVYEIMQCAVCHITHSSSGTSLFRKLKKCKTYEAFLVHC
mmetsp:Transcript_35119/g.69228  ORF Transcript_35119/g.69228 Transcript_35119/m.69228 type:complete len:94 (+) Transcript_35119:201-482(+)